jgi:hypothetical protein
MLYRSAVSRASDVVSFASSPDPESPGANGTTSPPSGAARPQVVPTHAELARWLLVKETSGESDAPGLSDAAERVCQKLTHRLSRLVSAAGSQALVSRALYLARAEFPFLDGVSARAAPVGCFEGLSECVHGIGAAEASQGLLAVLSRLLDLLVGFIGEDLTLRLVREVWPGLPLLEPGRPGNPAGQEAFS